MSDFSLNQLTEGIRQRNVGSQGRHLVDKWSRTGLLRGLQNVNRENMARLLENQAAQVLREASSVSTGAGNLAQSGDLRGFTNIAFPIVRRVFGGLIANDLVSVQPMSLPSGLLFYLDYTTGADQGADDAAPTQRKAAAGESLYGEPAGSVRTGVTGVGGNYDLAANSRSRTFKHVAVASLGDDQAATGHHVFTIAGDAAVLVDGDTTLAQAQTTGVGGKLLQFDPQITDQLDSGAAAYVFGIIPWDTDNFTGVDDTMLKEIAVLEGAATSGLQPVGSEVQTGTTLNVRRLNRLVRLQNPTGEGIGGDITAADLLTLESVGVPPALEAPSTSGEYGLLVVLRGDANPTSAIAEAELNTNIALSYPLASSLNTGTGDTLVLPAMESNMVGDGLPVIPEIDIKVEAVPVVAETRKLRAKWSPELAQDLNAYHSLDAEVELTQILSEQIALEIDREILNDLLTQATAANFFWSRAPGRFLNKETAAVQASGFASFTGTVREWYETLVETIIDVANQIHRKTLRGSANFIVVGPDVATILEASVFYKPAYSIDGDGQVSQPMTIGADVAGNLSNRFTVYKDPYFPRNKILVGYKGGSYLETGYVYAPYVPLIVTPTIFQPEDFTPRKGVMTRYGKKMVRSDFYGTVTCTDMSVI